MICDERARKGNESREDPISAPQFHPTPDPQPLNRACVAAAALIVAALPACDRGAGSSWETGEGPVVVQDSEVHVLGTSEALAVVEDLEVLADGTVWLQNSVEPFFISFDPEGGVAAMHGQRGGGPEEFAAPSGFVIGGIEGEAWVFDRQRHVLVQVSRPDSARGEIPLPRAEIPPGSVAGGMNLMSNIVRTARLGEEIILPRRSSPPEAGVYSYWLSLWTADLVALDREADSVSEVIALETLLGDPGEDAEITGGFPPFPLWFRLWAVCTDNELRVFDRMRNEVRRFTRVGSELDPIALPPPPHGEVTPREFARVTFDVAVVERMGQVTSGEIGVSSADSAQILDRLLPRLQDKSPEQLAHLLPRYVDFRCAEDGTQWIRPLDIERGGLRGGPVWLRITTDGATREVRFPDRFDPYRFTPDRVWGVRRDELDVASVAWIALPRARREGHD